MQPSKMMIPTVYVGSGWEPHLRGTISSSAPAYPSAAYQPTHYSRGTTGGAMSSPAVDVLGIRSSWAEAAKFAMQTLWGVLINTFMRMFADQANSDFARNGIVWSNPADQARFRMIVRNRLQMIMESRDSMDPSQATYHHSAAFDPFMWYDTWFTDVDQSTCMNAMVIYISRSTDIIRNSNPQRELESVDLDISDIQCRHLIIEMLKSIARKLHEQIDVAMSPAVDRFIPRDPLQPDNQNMERLRAIIRESVHQVIQSEIPLTEHAFRAKVKRPGFTGHASYIAVADVVVPSGGTTPASSSWNASGGASPSRPPHHQGQHQQPAGLEQPASASIWGSAPGHGISGTTAGSSTRSSRPTAPPPMVEYHIPPLPMGQPHGHHITGASESYPTVTGSSASLHYKPYATAVSSPFNSEISLPVMYGGIPSAAAAPAAHAGSSAAVPSIQQHQQHQPQQAMSPTPHTTVFGGMPSVYYNYTAVPMPSSFPLTSSSSQPLPPPPPATTTISTPLPATLATTASTSMSSYPVMTGPSPPSYYPPSAAHAGASAVSNVQGQQQPSPLPPQQYYSMSTPVPQPQMMSGPAPVMPTTGPSMAAAATTPGASPVMMMPQHMQMQMPMSTTMPTSGPIIPKRSAQRMHPLQPLPTAQDRTIHAQNLLSLHT